MSMVLSKKPALRGRWIPWLFVGGFGVVIAVNAILIIYATQTFSGLVVEHPYRKGLEYNAGRAQLDAQARLGWQYQVALVPVAGEPGTARIELRWIDAASAPLDGLVLEGMLQRPVENMAPLPVAFTALGSGRYATTIELPKRGAWDLHLQARRNTDRFAMAERLMLP